MVTIIKKKKTFGKKKFLKRTVKNKMNKRKIHTIKINKIKNNTVQYGGDEEIITYEEIIRSINEDQFEICGYINDSDDIVKTTQGPSVRVDEHGQRIPGERGSCNQDRAYNIMWHTHPSISKYYPSMEDILSVLKHGSIKISLIFTEYGVWNLIYNNFIPCLKNKTPELTKLQSIIQTNLDAFYHKIKIPSKRTANNKPVNVKRFRYDYEATMELEDNLNIIINNFISKNTCNSSRFIASWTPHISQPSQQSLPS